MIKIIADSTCDLPVELIEKYQIGIAPLSITINGVTYKDKVDIQADEFYAMLSGLDVLPTTAMPSPSAFYELMENAYLEGVREFLVITMSSGTSGSFQSADIAKNMFLENHDAVKVHVVDSLSMSHGSGWLILKSARLRDKGMSFEELVDFNEAFKKHVKHFLSVDDLNNLIKSGRLTNASAFIGKLLKIKPIMSMRDGKGAIVAKERGRNKVIDHYIAAFKERNHPEMNDFIIIGYTSDKSVAEGLKEKFVRETGFAGEILILQMGVAVGTHVGLGGLSMFFMEKDRKHDGLLVNELNNLKEKKDGILKRIKELYSGEHK